MPQARDAGAGEERRVELAIARSQVDEKRGDAARAARAPRRGAGARTATRDGDRACLLARAAVDDRRGDWQRALARAEKVLAREPRNVEALNFVGLRRRRPRRTTCRARSGGCRRPWRCRRARAAIIDSLGLGVLPRGDLARADVYLEQAGRLEPGDPEMLEHLGDLYAQAAGARRALAAYRRALGFKPSDRVARELGERIRTLEAKSAAGR